MSNVRLIPARPVNVDDSIAVVRQPLSTLNAADILSSRPISDKANEAGSEIDRFRIPSTFGLFRNRVPSDKLTDDITASSKHDPFALDNPNIVHPFPVPFLRRPPQLSQADVARPMSTNNGNATLADQRTLPPSIVVADHTDKTEKTSGESKNEAKQAKNVEVESTATEIKRTEKRIVFDSTER